MIALAWSVTKSETGASGQGKSIPINNLPTRIGQSSTIRPLVHLGGGFGGRFVRKLGPRTNKKKWGQFIDARKEKEGGKLKNRN